MSGLSHWLCPLPNTLDATRIAGYPAHSHFGSQLYGNYSMKRAPYSCPFLARVGYEKGGYLERGLICFCFSPPHSSPLTFTKPTLAQTPRESRAPDVSRFEESVSKWEPGRGTRRCRAVLPCAVSYASFCKLTEASIWRGSPSNLRINWTSASGS